MRAKEASAAIEKVLEETVRKHGICGIYFSVFGPEDGKETPSEPMMYCHIGTVGEVYCCLSAMLSAMCEDEDVGEIFQQVIIEKTNEIFISRGLISEGTIQ